VILLTGATGFIGRRVLRRLLSEGAEVRALVRPQSRHRLDRGAQAAIGDLTDPSSLQQAVACCRTVIHLAGLRGNWHADPLAAERVNVAGTHTLLQYALEAGVERVLCVSTFLVLGPSQGSPRTEADRWPMDRALSEYQRTRILADLECRTFLDRGLPVITVYPSIVYGPSVVRGESLISDLARAHAKRRVVLLVGTGHARRNLAYIDDVVEGLLQALEAGQPGQGYNLGGEDVSQVALFDLLDDLTGRRVPRCHLPATLVRSAGWLLEAVAAATKRPPRLTRASIDVLFQEWRLSSEKAQRDLGYRPTPLKEGLRRTLAACHEGDA